jgi:elongation factor Ts
MGLLEGDMSVDVEAIKILRQRSSAGLMDCRRALAEAGGEAEAAEALLKEWGLAAVEKRSDRETLEGRVFIHSSSERAAMVELACETDFVARNEVFRATGARLAELAWRKGLSAPDPEAEAIVAGLAGVIKENLVLKRIALLGRPRSGYLATYLHGEDRIGVLLSAEAGNPEAFADGRVLAFLHDLCLHVAAFSPSFIDGASQPADYIEARLAAYRDEVAGDERLKGKPEAMLGGIAAGKLRKHLAEASLLGHGFVRDEKVPVSAVLADLEARTGYGLSIASFACFRVGEGGGADA